MIKGLKNLSYEERMINLALLSLGKRRLRGNLVYVYKHLREVGDKWMEAGFSWCCVAIKQGVKQKHRKIHTNK